MIEYSVVIPVYNEEDNVGLLYKKIDETLRSTQKSYEIIFVDDGSSDTTYKKLRQLKSNDPHLKVIKFRTNFGQSAAMGAGFEFASGNIVIAMDGDLQNDPKDIPKVINTLNSGYDVVSGWRKNRKDKLIIRKVPSRIANRLVRRLTGVSLHDTGCSLKAYTKDIVKKIRVYGEFHRFIPALARIEGAKIGETVVTHHPRKFGKSKYNITRTFRVMMDLTTLNLFLKYLMNPTRFFGVLGFIFSLLGTIILSIMIYCVVVLNYPLEDINVLLAIAFLCYSSGFQLLFFGFIANMVVKTGDRNNNQIYETYPKFE